MDVFRRIASQREPGDRSLRHGGADGKPSTGTLTGHGVPGKRAISATRTVSGAPVRTTHILLLVTHKYDIGLDTIVVNESPWAAETNHILVSPTLPKELSPPVRRVVGDLSNEQDIFVTLHIVSLRGTNNRTRQRKSRLAFRAATLEVHDHEGTNR